MTRKRHVSPPKLEPGEMLIEAAAKRLDRSVSTVYYHTREKASSPIPCVKRKGHLVFREVDLDKWLAGMERARLAPVVLGTGAGLLPIN